MINKEDFRKILLPLIKGLPIIALSLLIAVFIALRTINYSIPMYEATAKIKLDDQQFGVSHNNLFKDFDMFSTVNKIDAEVELLKSQLLMSKALSRINADIIYYRIGKVKTSEMYNESPFRVKFKITDSLAYQTAFYLTVKDSDQFELTYNINGKSEQYQGKFNIPVKTGISHLLITKTNAKVSSGEARLIDQYSFRILSRDQQLKNIETKHLDIKALDKDIPIIRLSYRSEVPEKSADFINALAESYINDYVSNKSVAAGKTVDFIDSRLSEIASELNRSEDNLQTFKLDNGVVNTYQETETGLRKLSELRIQQTNLEMNETALNELYAYVISNKDFSDAAPNFGFGDLLFTESVKSLRTFTNEKRELLTKYTSDNERVKTVEAKIADLKKYIVEAIKNSRKDINIKKQQLDEAIELASHEFDHLPIRERKQLVLERTFRLNEKMYNFLSEKKMEAMMAEQANICFHRIIQYATPAVAPVSPNKTLIVFVSALLGLFAGITIVLLMHSARGHIESRNEIEKHSSLPLAGIVRSTTSELDGVEEAGKFIKTLQLLDKFAKGQIITITSSLNNEGKSHLAATMARAAVKMGYKTLLIDADTVSGQFHHQATGLTELLQNPSLVDWFTESFKAEEVNMIPLGDYKPQHSFLFNQQTLAGLFQQLLTAADIIIIDAPASTISIDAVTLMKISQLSLYLSRHNKTNYRHLANAAYLQEEYGINNLLLVLNDYKGSANFNGHFSGAIYSKLSFWQRLKNRMEIPAFIHQLLNKPS